MIQSKMFFLMVFLSASLLLMLVSGYKKDLPAQIRGKSYDIVGSLQKATFSLKLGLTTFLENLHEVERLRQENQALKRKVEELLLREQIYYQEVLSSNQRWQELLEFKQRQAYSFLPVKVVAYAPHDYFKVIFVGKGKEEGIEKDMVVVNARGLVGRVIEVYPHRARVLLILDERSKVGVRLQRTRDVAIIQGRGEEGICELKYLLNKAEVEVGDKVITSGLGGLFPEGILVGEISQMRKNPYRLFQEVKVIPAVDFGKLEELLAIGK